MSLYSQSYYGQPSYTAPSFTQPQLHHGYQYQYPPALAPPPPIYHVDPATFRRDYSNHLAELNVNSRPIIQNLSMLAQEFSRFAEIVAQCLETHIRRVSHLFPLNVYVSFTFSTVQYDLGRFCGIVQL
jgi:pre-mRNA cleavage complex 2 protein Pcf11